MFPSMRIIEYPKVRYTISANNNCLNINIYKIYIIKLR